jgi:2-deoxy-D-gluconate 3-dehydrogenase
VALLQRGAAEETVADLEGLGRRAFVAQVDLEDPEEAAAATARAAEAFGRLDVCVCNAGTTTRIPMLDLPLEDFRRVLDINLVSAFAVSREAARIFVAQGGGGRIVHIASVMAFVGGIRIGPYTASKGGLAQLAKAQSNEWAPHGITVNAIAPGYVETELNAPLRADASRLAEISSRIPVGRWASGDDIAGLAVWLATPAAAYVTGSVLVVDGGFLAR